MDLLREWAGGVEYRGAVGMVGVKVYGWAWMGGGVCMSGTDSVGVGVRVYGGVCIDDGDSVGVG